MSLAVFNSASFVTTSGLGLSVNPTIEVRLESDNSLAAIFTDAGGGTPITNPSAFGDSVGRFSFAVAGSVGGYKITVTKGAESFTLRGVAIGTAGQYDATAFLASGGQVVFPATQNPSADANTLDDYEEGTFTPGISFGGGTTGITYAAQVGNYTKIGRMVVAEFGVTLSAKGSSTGQAKITGLPVAANASSLSTGAVKWANTAGNWVDIVIGMDLTTVILSGAAAAAATNTTLLTDASFGNTTTIQGSIVYFV